MTAPLVLLVDDEFDIVATLQMLLQLEGVQVTTARNGQEALERVRERRPSVILTDFMMPLMNGIELCRRLRADHRTRDIPIILSSAVAPTVEPQARLYDAFVRKPADFDALFEQIRTLSGRRPRREARR